MPVRGTDKVRQRLKSVTPRVPEAVEDALREAAEQILSDMRALAPKDTGKMAASLAYRFRKDGLAVDIGLPGPLTDEIFWARFIELGTKGGTVRNRKNGKRFEMRVPARPARPFMQPALDMNIDDVMTTLRSAIRIASSA